MWFRLRVAEVRGPLVRWSGARTRARRTLELWEEHGSGPDEQGSDSAPRPPPEQGRVVDERSVEQDGQPDRKFGEAHEDRVHDPAPDDLGLPEVEEWLGDLSVCVRRQRGREAWLAHNRETDACEEERQ